MKVDRMTSDWVENVEMLKEDLRCSLAKWFWFEVSFVKTYEAHTSMLAGERESFECGACGEFIVRLEIERIVVERWERVFFGQRSAFFLIHEQRRENLLGML